MQNKDLKEYKIKLPSKYRFTKIIDDLYWARLPLPFRLDHVNIFAINSVEGLVIVDTGLNNFETMTCWNSIIKNFEKENKVSKLLISHHHPDHIGLSKFLSEKLNIKVYAPKNEILRAEKIINLSDKEYGQMLSNKYEEFGLARKAVLNAKTRGNFYRSMIKETPFIKGIDRSFFIETEYGKWNVRFDTGHSPSQLSLYDEVRKIYLCFDFLLPRISPNISVGIEDIENNILGKYINYLEDVKNNFDEEWIVFPGHEFPYFDPVKRASSLINHHENRLDLLYKSIKIKSINVKTAMDLLFGSIKNDHDLFFAIFETKAHLNLLVNNKKINMKKINNQIIYCN